MATTYKIFFTNYSGFANNFAFFSATPIVTNNGGSPVYSNIIASQYVPADNGDTTFEIDVTQTYYAWTSISPIDTGKLPGTNVVTKISNSKLATLGTSGSPGSTFKLVNSGGNPTFDGAAATFQAPDGTFQIASDPNAFQPDQNFICGLGSVDGNGQRIPVATRRAAYDMRRNTARLTIGGALIQFAAQPNTVATIAPVVKFYIAQYGSQQGTVINVSILSNKAAEIDFTGKGVHAAFVKQLSGGGWEVKYGTAKAMHEASQAFTAKQKRSLLNARQQDIAKLMGLLQANLDPVDDRYLCSFKWANGTTTDEKTPAVADLVAAMTGHGYDVITQPSGPNYDPANFGISATGSASTVANNWTQAVNALGAIASDPKTIDANLVSK
ncbi:uncharacterized protein Triagg1_2411 [Trichoderma aggressivum f. europaeum]|uniref:Uncharacterized protein n=1 Tax=Trichoderma aggressivum f. europaeum TaxID=173218 RepID=A0AAE1IHU5_9HYPO|nr:hypothetical protein Triagg1_2411 [Trichoderma aggressivum f. europaeum]